MTHPATRYLLRCGGRPMTKITSLIAPLPMMPAPTDITATLFDSRSAARHARNVTLRKLRTIRSSIICETRQFKEAFGLVEKIDPNSIQIVTLPATERGCQACARMGVPFERLIVDAAAQFDANKRRKK